MKPLNTIFVVLAIRNWK